MFGLINPITYAENFYNVYTLNSRRKSQSDRKFHAKLKNKDKKYAVSGVEGNIDHRIANPLDTPLIKEQLLLCPAFPVAHIVLQPNASQFAIFSVIRSTVLEADTRRLLFYDIRHLPATISCCSQCVETCVIGGQGECSCHAISTHTLSTTPGGGGGSGVRCGVNEKRAGRDSANSDADSETEECSEKDVKSIVVPLIVGAGLRSLFELISEARHIQPMLCSKALKALLDVIQGQEPESFKHEPEDLINALYDLLLDLTTMPSTTAAEGDWSAMACSALVGLCIARGDTGQMLKAIAAMLMAPRQLSSQRMQMPAVLNMLQRTVISAALGKPACPDFYKKGIPQNSLVDQFCIKAPLGSVCTKAALASDGTYLYLLLGGGLYKIGTGYNSSYKGHVYKQNDDFTKEKTGWLGYSGGQLYYRRKSKRNGDHLHLVNTDTLTIKSMNPVNMLPIKDGFNYTLFTDESSLNAICTNRDDILVVRRLNISTQKGESGDLGTANELPLQLSRKRFRTLGYAVFEEEVLNQNQILKIQSSYNNFEPKILNEVQEIGCGKEFGLVCATNGKVYYYGKSAALGLKSIGRTPIMKLTELIISKMSRVVHVCVGHDGIHALLVNDDGSVYFTGTARRGEDGDVSKNRRQPKAMKPKKMTKIENHFIVQAACNNGTSAFVTKSGKLIMFGKDTMHCDSQGLVSDFTDQHIQKVALGKAHCVAVNSKGQVFTFGLNNKGQCGHVFSKNKDSGGIITTHATDAKAQALMKKLKFDFSNLCDYDDHNVVQGQCRVCVLCKECTGYNVSCVALNVPLEGRVSGAACACGHGDAGCSKCGLCISCIAVQEADNVSDAKDANKQLNRQRSKTLIVRRKDKKTCDDSSIHTEDNPPRVAPLPPQLLQIPSSSPVVQVACGLHHTVLLTVSGEVFTFGSNQFGQLGTGDLQPVIGPIRVNVSGHACPVPVRQVAAGSNHTVLLTYKGLVYTFGNYQKGQLGRLPHDGQSKHNSGGGESNNQGGEGLGLSSRAAESSSTVAQLLAQRQKILWHCTPGTVFGIGPSFGKKAIWIGASGDQTFIKIDESLITAQMLSKINVIANKKTILMVPTVPLNFQTISINRRDGSCTAHYNNQVDFSKMDQVTDKPKTMPEVNQNIDDNMMSVVAGSSSTINEQMSRSMHEARNQLFDLQDNQRHNNIAPVQRGQRGKERNRDVVNAESIINEKSCSKLAFAMDPLYDVLWVYDGNNKKVLCYNILASEINVTSQNSSHYQALLAPELSLPCKLECRVSRLQASLNLLVCLDILTSAQDVIPSCFEDITPKQENQSKDTKDNQYQAINRFDNFGGGWGYSGHSVEAIRFSVDTDVILYGFGMFGGRGEYSCKLKVHDLGVEGGDYEKEGPLVSETQEVPFECPARSIYHILLPKPVTIMAGRWYLVSARIAGPSSDCGSCGQASLTTEDQVIFTFKSSKKANNGTDVNSGQIPAILYRLITLESKQPTVTVDVDPVKRVTNEFANNVTKECFESLVLLLNWSWEAFKGHLREQRDMSDQLQVKQSLQYLKHVNKCCLRLLRKYTNEIYPEYGFGGEDMIGEGQRKGKNEKDSMKPPHKPGSSQFYTNAKNHNDMIGVGQQGNVMRKPNMENIQLAECIGNVRAMLIGIFCDDIFQDIWSDEAFAMASDILNECHISFVNCFGVFYPTSTLKWNCLCDSLSEMDKGTLHSRLLSAILAGLCSPTVKLRSTFALLGHNGERQSIISPSDNSGLPMLSATDSHQYPILVEQMIYRTQQEKSDFLSNTWTFKDILVRLLNIMANPIRDKIESVYSRNTHYNYSTGSYGSKSFNQGLTDNCCNLLARVLAEIVYQMALGDYDKMFIPPRSLHSSGSRFSRCDQRRTWSTGNFGPDAIAFTVDRCGIAIAGAMVYSGSGSYEYQLDLLFDNSGTEQTLQQQQQQQPQHKWETLESITGTYDQGVVHNRMADIKFERSVLIKENTRYALRLCSQGARTCSGDGGMPSVRGPCGTIFHFYACDLSFNGTNAQRGQIPCILYYSTPLNQENNYLPGTTGLTGLTETSGGGGGGGSGGGVGISTSELTMRDTALQIITDINKKCSELLILARNTLAASLSPSDNSSNNSPTMDSEHNITPIEEHMDINWANNSRTSALPAESGGGLSSARDLSKRLESFSKGIIETLKFEKRSTNPFEMEIEIGATEIHPKDLIIEENASVQELNQITKFNGNERMAAEAVESYTLSSQYNAMGGRVTRDSNETPAQMTVAQILEIFNLRSSNLFHTLLPLVYAHIANLACSDAKSSVHILGLIKDILPHVVALNQLHITKELDTDNPISSLVPNLRQLQLNEGDDKKLKTPNEGCGNGGGNISGNELPTTSNHYCIVECEHPYRSASVHCYRVEFPACVQWLTIEFDGQCGTAQLEDCLLVSIPLRPLKSSYEPCHTHDDFCDILDNNIKLSKVNGKHATLLTACYPLPTWGDLQAKTDPDWIVVKKFNTPSNWLQSVMILPGNCVEFTLETSSHYAQDPHVNRYGFKCLVVGYDNPILLNDGNTSLMRIEQELAYLGGMCSANLMKKNLSLPDDKDVEDLTSISETISSHFALLSKGLALSEPELSIHQALESYLPIGSQSNERQFLKDFISGAPGSSGARLAAWLQPEPRLDPNKCELNTITEPLRCGWPTQMTITIHDQYGDAIVVPELKVEVKATPTGTSCNEAPAKQHRALQTQNGFGGVVPPPRVNYEATLKENMCFKAITFMKPYHNYSFEELRYNSPVQTRVTETLYAQDMEDGMFSVHWTPTAVGSYCLTVTIDGILLEEVHRVEVKEGNMPPPSHRRLTKNSHTPNKLRKFYTENTAGLRIRSHPTLQSEQVGVIKLNGIITFVDEIENDDGVWLRLSTESIRQHCTIGWYPTEAWCLQYNQHFNKILLHPVVETACTTSSNSENNVGDPDSSVSPSVVTVSALDLKPKHREVVENLEPVTSNLDSPPLGQQPSVKSSSPKKSASDVSFESYTQSIDGQITISTNPFFCNEPVADNKTFPISNPEQFQSSAKNGELSGPEEEIQSVPITGPTNAIGSAIAGVVGGGAIKLQALQKWFKGDTLNESNYGREHHQPFKCSDVSEIASVSVRELVRVMGNQDNKSNGNSSAHQRRSSSPLPIPFDKSTDSPNNSVKSSETSDTSGIISSTTTQDSNKSERRSASTQFDVINMRKTNFTPSQTAALLSTPKHSLRKGVGSWKATFNTALSTSPETSAIKGADLSNLEEEVSLLEITTTTTQDQKVFSELRTTCSTGSTEHSSPPVWPEPIGSAQSNQNAFFKTSLNNKTIPMGPIKRAMPPSFAESIRAVFAAFLWHEGIVHDAMACASFLKFHPNLPKEGTTVITRRDHGDTKQQLSREEKAQQRHSVEVANAGNYLNIRPSTLETLTKSGNFTVHNRKYRKSQASERDGAEGGDKAKLQALPEIVTVLPPALRSLVFLWEHICTNCVQMVQYNSMSQEKVRSREHSAETRNRPVGKDSKESKKTKKKKDDGSWCEVCQVFLPIPVTYHMRMAHPGCGKPAKGKGYNSVGIYCEGWAGNCGEGGKGAASWFIMCETCRDKYISNNTNINNLNNTNPTGPGNELNMFGLKNTALLANSEIYTTMRENANFLLELSSNIINIRAEPTIDIASGVMNNSKRSPQQMPVVVEHQHFTAIDVNKPSTSRGEASRHSRIGLKINGKYGGSSFRKSSCSQERPWLAPETFACLETFGTINKEEMPYKIFGLGANDSCIERPLSDISYELSEPINHETASGQANCMTNSSTLSKFHRSFSMGQGWGMMQQKSNQFIMRQEDNYYPKAAFRRRNNSSTDAAGSLLICYPSENLRRLVPEHMLVATSVVPQLSESDVKVQKVERSRAMSNLDLESANHVSALVQRPSLTFITQKHDLKKLRSAMKRSLRIATCRNYSLQALNWLLRSVTQNVCLHDLMWWFVSSLSTSTATTTDPFDGKYDDYEAALEHPVSYTQISGCLSYMITDSLHKFLQSVADLTLYLPLGSPLQRIAIQCFGIRFRQTDHQFLHSSHVFGNISKILSKSDEQNENSHLLTLNDNLYAVNNGEQNATVGGLDVGGKVIYYSDLNGHFEITVSSRQRMVEALTDNSTETFWESDEEDRNKSKMIEITMNKLIYCCKMLLVHIDNSRDIHCKVSNVTFYGGQSLGDTTLIKSMDVDAKCSAWVTAKIYDDNFTHFRLEFSGPENTLRIRQIKLLGLPAIMCGIGDYLHNPYELPNNSNSESTQLIKNNLKLMNALHIQQQICESETLRVFRLITSQVFGKLITTEADSEEMDRMGKSDSQNALGCMDSSVNSMLADSLDLREHMVGILFSRSKLSHLQKQVIVHIVHAIKKEARRTREDWDAANLSDNLKGNIPNGQDSKSETSSELNRTVDTYCFEMLSMVLALSGSVVGRSYLSHQHGLIKDLLTLLHAGSDRVQRQVTSLLRRILPEISPATFADILGVHRLPPNDYNIAHQIGVDFDMNHLGLLDIFLAVIAKSLHLQVKVKSVGPKVSVEKPVPSLLRLCNVLDLSIHLLKPKKPGIPSEGGDVTITDTFSCNDYAFAEYEHFGGSGKQTRPVSRELKKEPQKNLNQRWFLNGVIPRKQAESIIGLIRDLATGKMGEKWSQTTKAAIAEAVLNLTRLDDVFRTPDTCIKTATLWLALASLCVLDAEHVEKLSSGQWAISDTRPLCSNHDDGETPAMIQCESCGSLCGDCDRFLHLNRKTRTHKRTVCKEEEEAIRVELHESCGRTKLFWLLALADSKTLKSIVEFRDGNHTIISSSQESVGRCRFCGITGNSGLLEIGNVCADIQCQEHAANACMKTKSCGHACGGVVSEKKCLPCLHHVCHARENEISEGPKLTQDADDMCMICFVEALACAPSIQLVCGHVFHYHCCKTVLEKRWNGPRITFGFSLCPICKTDIEHPMLADVLEPINVLKQDVKRKALIRIKYEGLVPDKDDRDLTSLAMDRYAYYVCFKCQKAYYGGEARCDAEIGEHFNREELVCGGCSDVARAQMCPKHGTDFLEYKCRYCCSVAVYFCFGTTHFCNACHDGFQNVTNIPKSKLPQCPAGPKGEQLMGDECPLHVMHPSTGEEFALGCGVCRKAQTF